MDKSERIRSSVLFASRSEWHNTVLVSLCLLLSLIVILKLLGCPVFYTCLVFLPIIVFFFTSGLFSYRRCPSEKLPLDNMDFIFHQFSISLGLIILCVILTYIAIKTKWAFISILPYSLVLLVGNPRFKISEIESRPSGKAITSPTEQFIQPETSVTGADKALLSDYNIGVILGTLGIYTKDYVTTKKDNSVSVITKNGVDIIVDDNSEHLSIIIKLGEETTTFSFKSIESLASYREVLLSFAKLINDYNS